MSVRSRLVSVLVLAAFSVLLVGFGTSELSAQDKPESYNVDKVHSSILFKVKHANAAFFFGRFIDFSGSITYDRDNPKQSQVNLTVKADSVRTWSEKRDNHLRSPDFLNVKQYPEISFESTSVQKVEDKKNKFKVTGDFSLHGKTKELTIDVEKTGEGKGPEGNPRIGFYTEIEISRSEFGMTKYAGMIGDTVKLIISIEGVSK